MSLTKEQKEKLHKLYSKGTFSHFQIAEKVGLEYKQVYGYFKENYHVHYYVKPPRNKYTRRSYAEPAISKDIKKAYAQYLGGWTLEKVGKEYGNISRERVRQVFERHGLKTRGVGKVFQYKSKVCPECDLEGHWEGGKKCPTCVEANKKKRAKGLHFKTHCKNGHVMAGHNLIEFKYPNGLNGRRCRACSYAAMRRSIKKKREKL